jgi:YfiH family protein
MQFHPDFLFPSIRHLVIDKSFQGVNYKYRLSDDPAIVASNLDYIKEYLKADELVILHQIHSNKVMVVDDKNITIFKDRQQADGLVTRCHNIALGILTADCIPLFFVDSKNMVIGLAHAGWKGARYGIIEETIAQMEQIGACLDNIHTLIGPCIHQESYEIDRDFYKNFMNESGANQEFFIESVKSGHYMFDLPGYARSKLINAGLKNIFQIPNNTFKMKDLYPSYRRSTLYGEEYSESILSILHIQLKK